MANSSRPSSTRPPRSSRTANKKQKTNKGKAKLVAIPKPEDEGEVIDNMEIEEEYIDDADLKGAHQSVTVATGESSSSNSAGSDDNVNDDDAAAAAARPSIRRRVVEAVVDDEDDDNCRFLGAPIPEEEALARWPDRYKAKERKKKVVVKGKGKKKVEEEYEDVMAKRHFYRAEVDGKVVYDLFDHAHVKPGEGESLPYICKIVELFEGVDGHAYFSAQWYYRGRDTIIKEGYMLSEDRRVFLSEVTDDNPLGCLMEKLTILRVPPNWDKAAKKEENPNYDYYYDMMYLLPYTSFVIPPEDHDGPGSKSKTLATCQGDSVESIAGAVCQENMSTVSVKADCKAEAAASWCNGKEGSSAEGSSKKEMVLLDLYSGCGGMSTGLCLGANKSKLNLVTRWAVDMNADAIESLALNHPETKVRKESVDDFLLLLKEWQRLCTSFQLIEGEERHAAIDAMIAEDEDNADDEEEEASGVDEVDNTEVFEVENIKGICYGDLNQTGTPGLYLKVGWKGYGSSYDSWEPFDGLGNCRESIGRFVADGFRDKILPLPGDVDMICGGPPCQGMSGFNRFRMADNPLADPRNSQLIVYMDVVDYLKPKFVLMENVVDLFKFAKGKLGRYAVGRLVDNHYQCRMGMVAAGAYGLPQFRMRCFIWGALPSQKLPPFPLPTHDVLLRGVIPLEVEDNLVAYNEDHTIQLEGKLFLGDAISELPEVRNDESRDVMPYSEEPRTNFQRIIRLSKDALLGMGEGSESSLYDHRPLKLNDDDVQRVARIPKEKGANFRNFPGVLVGPDNKVYFDPTMKREYLPSGKPVVPDYAMSFVRGTSSKPFGRLWWDETVPTVVTRAEPHNQVISHPSQDRVLTIRENARLQGFPDYYQLKGAIKQRYMQVGNAVAVPVAWSLGEALAASLQNPELKEPVVPVRGMFSQ